jgi:hypothetical protein
MDRHIQSFRLARFIDFHRSDPVYDPQHPVSKDERPDGRKKYRALPYARATAPG